jgi:hypothetical protein
MQVEIGQKLGKIDKYAKLIIYINRLFIPKSFVKLGKHSNIKGYFFPVVDNSGKT